MHIREERRQLKDQVQQLQVTNQRQADDLARANFTIEVCREQLEKLKQATQSAGLMPQATATPSGNRLPTYQEMGGHVRLSTVSGTSPVPTATASGLSMPPTLTPVWGTTPGPQDAGTPTLPRLTPQPSTSLAATPPQQQEEEMDSEPQKGPESQQ